MIAFVRQFVWTPRMAVAAMLVSMLVFGANFAVSRHGIQHGLTPYDIAALRFGISGFILLPIFIHMGVGDCAGVGWGRGLALAVSGGIPVTLLMSLGASLAPAAHGAALGPGTVTMVGVAYGILVAGRLPPVLTRIGLAFALLGLAAIAIAGSASGSRSVMLGDLSFFCTGLLWGFYPILLHRWRVGGMVGAIVSAVVSLVYLPVYVSTLDIGLSRAPVSVVVVQALYQGILNAILALWLWGQGVKVLGASGTQLFPPLIPVIGTLAAIPILGEWPGPHHAVGIALIVGGLALSALGNRTKPPVRSETSTDD